MVFDYKDGEDHFGEIGKDLFALKELGKETLLELREGFREVVEKVEKGTKEVIDQVDKVANLVIRVENFLKEQGMGQKASLTDSCSIAPDKKKLIEEFKKELDKLPKEEIKSGTLSDLGRLFRAIGEGKQASELNIEALKLAKTKEDKAKAHYTEFMNLLEEKEWEKGLEEYKQAVSIKK